MFQLVDAEQTLEAVRIMQRAIDGKHVVRVSFLKQLTDRAGQPLWFTDRMPDGSPSAVMAALGRRAKLSFRHSHMTGEPVEIGWTTPKKEGEESHPYVRIIAYDKPGEHGFGVRTVRLDRLTVGPRGLSARIMPTRKARVRGTAIDPTVTPVPKRQPEGETRTATEIALSPREIKRKRRGKRR